MVAEPTARARPLSGLGIWYTRPLGSGGELERRCRDLGAQVWRLPVLAIETLPPSHPARLAARNTLHHLDRYRHIIFISGNAVAQGLPILAEYAPHWQEQMHCYAIGSATAGLLAGRGIPAEHPLGPRQDSEALLQHPRLGQLGDEAVLIVRGLGGRETLAAELRRRGARVDYLEVYRRVKSGTLKSEVNEQLAGGAFHFITAASGETVENVVDLVDDKLRERLLQIAIVVPGERVARVARSRGFERPVVALNASEGAMIEAILRAAGSQASATENTNNTSGGDSE